MAMVSCDIPAVTFAFLNLAPKSGENTAGALLGNSAAWTADVLVAVSSWVGHVGLVLVLFCVCGPSQCQSFACPFQFLAQDDQEALAQIQQMVKFILNEAKDKAQEIEARALEDFNIEKLKLVQQMKDKIRQEFDKKAKKLEVQRSM